MLLITCLIVRAMHRALEVASMDGGSGVVKQAEKKTERLTHVCTSSVNLCSMSFLLQMRLTGVVNMFNKKPDAVQKQFKMLYTTLLLHARSIHAVVAML